MSARREERRARRRRIAAAGELRIELSADEVLADLTWPGPSPGEWRLPLRPGPEAAHIDELLLAIEREVAVDG